MPRSITQSRSARQRALAGYESEPAPEPVGAYDPRLVNRASIVRAWEDAGELVEILEVRTPNGRRFEAIVTDDAGTHFLDDGDEPGAILAAKRYMRANSRKLDGDSGEI